jgi:hypothetical protein
VDVALAVGLAAAEPVGPGYTEFGTESMYSSSVMQLVVLAPE